MTQTYEVNATLLNLRRSPTINPANIIGKLGQGELVQVVGMAADGWAQVQNGHLAGFAASRYLSPVPTPAPAAPNQFAPPPVDFPPSPRATLNSTEQRHCPLGLQLHPRVVGQSVAARCTALHAIVGTLDVQHSARYQPAGTTYCNIYAHDFCRLAGVYLPRVWWTEKALLDLSRGVNPGVVYGKTVRELNANALFDWLTEWGATFNWKSCVDVNQLQAEANQGAVGIICAQRGDSRSGHIVLVLPETPALVADRVGQVVVRPLQSQAGAKNKRYFCNQWWIDLATQFRAHGFWACS